MWVVADLDDEYIAKMEDVLEVYERPYDPRSPSTPMCGPPRRRFLEERRDGITNMNVAGPPMFSVL